MTTWGSKSKQVLKVGGHKKKQNKKILKSDGSRMVFARSTRSGNHRLISGYFSRQTPLWLRGNLQ